MKYRPCYKKQLYIYFTWIFSQHFIISKILCLLYLIYLLKFCIAYTLMCLTNIHVDLGTQNCCNYLSGYLKRLKEELKRFSESRYELSNRACEENHHFCIPLRFESQLRWKTRVILLPSGHVSKGGGHIGSYHRYKMPSTPSQEGRAISAIQEPKKQKYDKVKIH
jgi:hypothetical protein